MWLAEKPSLRAASCWSVEVVKGGGGLRVPGLVSTDRTVKRPGRRDGQDAPRAGPAGAAETGQAGHAGAEEPAGRRAKGGELRDSERHGRYSLSRAETLRLLTESSTTGVAGRA